MKTMVLIGLGALAWTGTCLASRDSETWPVRDQETIEKSFPLSGSPMRVVVDNIQGYIHVTGVDGSQVRVVARKVIRAESDSDLEQARKEVQLQMTSPPGSVSVYYDAPWRCGDRMGDRGGRNCDGDRGRRFYAVKYDIDIQVPRQARIVVATVNEGDIRIDKTTGSFDVSDINGGISMTEVSGSGEVHTINGPVTVRFAKNPSAACTFKTLNGQVDVYFQRGLSADLSFKTFNGNIYSDFDVIARATSGAEAERRDGKFVYRSNRGTGGRIGTGGPELSFDAFNGNIRLHAAGN